MLCNILLPRCLPDFYVLSLAVFLSLLPDKPILLDPGLFEDGAERAFRHIAGMIEMVVWQRVAGRCQISWLPGLPMKLHPERL